MSTVARAAKKRPAALSSERPTRSASATGVGGARLAASEPGSRLTETFQGMLSALADPAHTGKLFPAGITKISLSITLTGGISGSIDIEGPTPKELTGGSDEEIMRLRSRVRSLIAGSNVDTSASDSTRATTYLAIVRDAVLELDGTNKENVVRFLVRTAWHEGAALTKRVQSGGGPARSFLQMEPGAAKDGVTRATQKGWLGNLATASGYSESNLKAAAADLSLGDPWPAGNLVEEGLKSADLFGVEVGRAFLSAGATPIPSDLDEQADFWESDWHRVTDAQKKAQWLANAKKVNKLLNWT
ncbi:MAG: hypothetical protein ABIR54_00980 [Burkholderiaceae bacterium]